MNLIFIVVVGVVCCVPSVAGHSPTVRPAAEDFPTIVARQFGPTAIPDDGFYWNGTAHDTLDAIEGALYAQFLKKSPSAEGRRVLALHQSLMDTWIVFNASGRGISLPSHLTEEEPESESDLPPLSELYEAMSQVTKVPKQLYRKAFTWLVRQVLQQYATYFPALNFAHLHLEFVADKKINAEAWCAPTKYKHGRSSGDSEAEATTPVPWNPFQSTITANEARPISFVKMQQLAAHEVMHFVQFTYATLRSTQRQWEIVRLRQLMESKGGAIDDADLKRLTSDHTDGSNALFSEGGAEVAVEMVYAVKDKRSEQLAELLVHLKSDPDARKKNLTAAAAVAVENPMAEVIEDRCSSTDPLRRERDCEEILAPASTRIRMSLLSADESLDDTRITEMFRWLVRIDGLKQRLSWPRVLKIARQYHELSVEYLESGASRDGDSRAVSTEAEAHLISSLRKDALVPPNSWPSFQFLQEYGVAYVNTYGWGKERFRRVLMRGPKTAKGRQFQRVELSDYWHLDATGARLEADPATGALLDTAPPLKLMWENFAQLMMDGSLGNL